MKKPIVISDHNAVIARIMAHDECHARRLLAEATHAKAVMVSGAKRSRRSAQRDHRHPEPPAAAPHISLPSALRGLGVVAICLFLGAATAALCIFTFTLLAR